MDVEELDGRWRFRGKDGSVVEITADGTIVKPPPDDRRIEAGDRVAYWDDVLLEASDWLADTHRITDLRLADGRRHDLSLLALQRAPRRPSDQPLEKVRWGPLLLAHHPPEHYERCAVIAGAHVCRRCLVLYPVAILAAIVSLVAAAEPARVDPVLLWLVPIPATLEFVGEQLGWWRYSRWRQVAVMVPMAAAFGRGLGRYLHDHSDRLFWTVLLVNCVIWGAAALLGYRKREREELLGTVDA